MKKILYIVTVEWFFLSHRLSLAQQAKKNGFEVHVLATQEKNLGKTIESYGFKFYEIKGSRSYGSIYSEIKYINSIRKILVCVKPDIVHNVGLKPIVYGGILSRFFKINKVINAVTGLGYLFINRSNNKYVFHLFKQLFKLSLGYINSTTVFQNELDKKEINNIIKIKNALMIPGSGVDINIYKYSKEIISKKTKILFVGRLLVDKGIYEFIDAAIKLIQKLNEKLEFTIIGEIDEGNRASLTKEKIHYLSKKYHSIKFLGHKKNVFKYMRESNIVVLPSYREGLSKVLIEACSVGRSIVTTNVPGCSDVVENKINGFLTPIKNSHLLSLNIEKLIKNPELRIEMGINGRIKAEKFFSSSIINNKFLNLYKK